MMNDWLNSFLNKKYKEQLFWIIFVITTVMALILFFQFRKIIGVRKNNIDKLENQKKVLFDEFNAVRQTTEAVYQVDDEVTQKLEFQKMLKNEIISMQNSFSAKNKMLQTNADNSEIYRLLTDFNDSSFVFKSIDYRTPELLNYISKESYSVKFYISASKLSDYLRNIENSKFYLTIEQLKIQTPKTVTDTNLIKPNSVYAELALNYYKLINTNYAGRFQKQNVLNVQEKKGYMFFDAATKASLIDEPIEIKIPEIIEEPVKPPTFKISGALMKGGKKYIISNDKLYTENDIVDDWKIQKILNDKLILENKNQIIEYPIFNFKNN